MACSAHQARNVAAQRIVSMMCARLSMDRAYLLGPRRDAESARARHLLCYVLVRAGFRRAQIARLIGRDHSTVNHALERVSNDPALAAAGQQLATAVLPYVDIEGCHGVSPQQAVLEALPARLVRVTSSRDTQAVLAYVRGPLLGQGRVPGPQADWGLRVIGSQVQVRAIVEETLTGWDLAPYAGHIGWRLRYA